MLANVSAFCEPKCQSMYNIFQLQQKQYNTGIKKNIDLVVYKNYFLHRKLMCSCINGNDMPPLIPMTYRYYNFQVFQRSDRHVNYHR